PSSAAYTFHLAAIARWATDREEHQLVLMWPYVQTTRFTETRGVQTADLARRPTGIQYVDHTEGDGAKMYAAVCTLGLEGIVSKRIDTNAPRRRNWPTHKRLTPCPRGGGMSCRMALH